MNYSQVRQQLVNIQLQLLQATDINTRTSYGDRLRTKIYPKFGVLKIERNTYKLRMGMYPT